MSLSAYDRIPHIRRGFRLQWEPVQDCHVLLYPEGMITLNASAGEILLQVDGRRDTAAIIAELERRYPDIPGVAADILAFLEIAHAQLWIEFQQAGA
ncbi:pyrroloquinoline quinone biosynthesis peptide chaperone PqqD [Stutzerimonas kirkiae]|uniref:PqqA binding protein n=1 Tax=Stutzerimonas kirkiae TaxID=2211392 RepID=A0A4Q9R1W4_9GAMM|nr:pyrroloquinoline quinone biosynthesis peptide chaperone PqqD [Stutzerimonas kirkiae]TBU91271.1 pyrroloquinoline quinone biosynthesis peptide chaperone PqqD [Stutzerimonas kirkiae]TBV00459.1 pyrroloquinoline quinone biosynthesis peptide chaperone PqqD [Stutzerimonas kirkiae]TBV11825.1 pyrroloquinoline quinone biosynthesis peptide chaperone PqqD [Stutzerimonas kirkiae]TBV15249.1 pyrroloquinoline quinone biosynthesis peptide chaperone PqqD [Stutzerimonas kirkiae]